LALGDIGCLFPDTDPTYEGADSLLLLQKVVQKVHEKGYSVENLDATILCQEPKLRPYIAEMRKNIAQACLIEPQRVSVKATTEEGLGFTGSGAGIAAHCVCLLTEKNS
jgi:2-C-methyl-D-erythritol 2,4-cyclodiphosphate synthase